MPTHLQQILNSRLFKFIVGETTGGTPIEFLVHEEAIAQFSKPLYNLIKGRLSEAQAGCTIWKDVSKQSFERLAQVAYTGDYSIPNTRRRNRFTEPEKRRLQTSKNKKKGKGTRLSSADWEVSEPEPQPESSLRFRTKRERYPEPPSPRLFATDLSSLQYPLVAPRNIHHATCETAEHFEPDINYSDVFLVHASMYVLGDFWLIDSLKALALYKLHRTLCIFQLNNENIEDIVYLARYAYNEETKGMEEGIGGLRSMICQYLAQNAAVLSLHAGFTDLLKDGGQFVQDLFVFAVQRMQ
ncbi:hypothetical protein BKA61DRAFT_642618 [Leptodontidium sp. MPI-SDFR-AT-0119]|nr:hypothetical protein BKA61DRAFT_642618 [Leptodontidium sp. MPI-SDFR-AT-0119]